MLKITVTKKGRRWEHDLPMAERDPWYTVCLKEWVDLGNARKLTITISHRKFRGSQSIAVHLCAQWSPPEFWSLSPCIRASKPWPSSLMGLLYDHFKFPNPEWTHEILEWSTQDLHVASRSNDYILHYRIDKE